MRASSGPQGQVLKPLTQVSDERRKAPEKFAVINLVAFVIKMSRKLLTLRKKAL